MARVGGGKIANEIFEGLRFHISLRSFPSFRHPCRSFRLISPLSSLWAWPKPNRQDLSRCGSPSRSCYHREKQVPHVLIFPFLAQGHINSMLSLAKLLSLVGFHNTFLNSDHNHHRLLRNADLAAWAARRLGFRFTSISNDLPPYHRRSAAELMTLFDSLKANAKPILREMLESDQQLGAEHPVTCIIGDGIMSFVIDVPKEVGLPVISFRG